ncbi:VanZ family protein [Clostridium botulinum]|uniref:VanZ family protein n=1 Tax=Clostridium botulinum TaxID=1491 RepID=A0A846J4D9_CLOBO|nr:VanZ family protein [Clostridium botulinum]ACA54517.1 vanZF protein [Clostridium botulinum A3 str. Loch Maree]NFH66788.1 VanZ family protein [Clostridium botulinum]NFJ06927.1 VanZ family protein [Clostridium botulinum]NFK13899.1 VanZ family protein [Clostridium botulinum]NFM94632.1 VanZ family protein [Clostridium botulinum]
MLLFNYLIAIIRTCIVVVVFRSNYLFSIICTCILCIVFQKRFYLRARKKEGRVSRKHLLGVSIFLLYLAGVYSVTGMGTIWDVQRFVTASTSEFNRIYLVPFSSSEVIMPYVFNIIMTIPLGFLLPLIWKQFRTIKKVALSGFLLSLCIELSQLFTQSRTTTTDDLIMNTLGAIIGYFIFKAFFHIILKKNSNEKDEITSSSVFIKHEAIFYLVLSFLGMFLFAI